jgi:hypothetical protein
LSLLAPPYPLSQWYQQSNETVIDLNMRCSNSAFDAQGSRVITVVLHVRTVKIYVAGGKMKDKDKTQFIIKT